MKAEIIARPLKHIALIGNALPRQCGLATYTTHSAMAMRAAYSKVVIDHYAMDNGDGTVYDGTIAQRIDANDPAAYVRAGTAIAASDAQVVWVQHEFGIFGGAAGDMLLTLLRHCHQPVVLTLHTVLDQPDPDQRRVMDALARRADHLIVMADHAAGLLETAYGVPASRISVIPHGAPDRPFETSRDAKRRLGLPEGPILMSFGLLSPGKGIEYAIRALPRIVAAHPDLCYRVIGATHPNLRRDQGESYRDMLIALAEELGVGQHVVFFNDFLDDEALLDQLAACDIYVTPYLGLGQVTSGTLAYARALGKPVLSTPYIHAREVLAQGGGALIPPRDADALADACIALLADRSELDAVSRKVWENSRSTIWRENAARVMQVLRDAVAEAPARLNLPQRKRARSTNGIAAIEAFTDDVGIFQHSRFGIPDRNHGYCIDDNARALMLLCKTGTANGAHRRLMATYAAFIQHAWHPDHRRFRNFMGYDRRWLEEIGSEDSNGRTLWALGEAAGYRGDPDIARWAQAMLVDALPMAKGLTAPRAIAFAMLGIAAYRSAGLGGQEEDAFLRDRAETFAALLRDARRPDWAWFEAVLSYDNARLPQSLIATGTLLDERTITDTGLQTLKWIVDTQTAAGGYFRPVGTESFGKRYAQPEPFDQQPLEAAATIDACATAWHATHDPTWLRAADTAMAWFEGANDLGLSLIDERDGGCFDGLTPQGLNLNRGAESILALQMAIATLHQLPACPTMAPADAPQQRMAVTADH